MYYYYIYRSPVGELAIASNEKNIVGVWLEGQRYYMDVLKGKEYRKKETAVIKLAEKWLDKYFKGEKPQTQELPIEFIGSDFRKQVWTILGGITYGKVITYGDIAKQIAKQKGIEKMSAQAVGGAVGRNPISIIIPCHRVIGASGSLTGYSGGVKVKTKLLEFEEVDMSKLYIPQKGARLN
ncbi:MAG: methylated-DNA--[Lachnospiraceae bacterium]|nr:methylated-DNA--[protein]-cysteine S-methyltransferase [Lachnospiraceae bacterium]